MPRLELDGLSLHYRRDGNGPPLLLLAGMASDAASWQPVMPMLTRHYDTIAPDNRCAGRTRPIPVATSRELMLGDLLALLDHLRIERVSVLGHSMGGMLGWTLAAAAPDRVTALVAASALPEVLPVRVDFFRTLSRLRHTSEPADWYRLFLHALFSPAFFADPQRVEAAIIGALAYPHQQPPDALSVQAEALASFIDSPDVSRVRCPVLAITGELDLLMTPAMLAARHAGLDHVSLATVSGAAHSLHWEQPAAFLDTVLGFLDQTGSGTQA